MILVRPSALTWTLLAVPLVVLYLRAAGYRRQAIGTGFLWKRVFAEVPPGGAWWKWRRPVSLGIHLTALMLIVLAMAEPLPELPRRIVLVIDCSASMSATDVKPSRLLAAKLLARGQLSELGYRDEAAVLKAGGRVDVVCGLTGSQATLEQAVDRVQTAAGRTCVAEAVVLARRLLKNCPGGQILVLSDGCFEGSVQLAANTDVRLIPVAGYPLGAADNVGLTRLAARRALCDPATCQVFTEVTSFSAHEVDCRLEIAMDGKQIAALPVRLPPGGRWQQVFEMPATNLRSVPGGQITARLDRHDVLASDNTASVRMPNNEPNRVTSPDERKVYPKIVTAADLPGWDESDIRTPAGLDAEGNPAAASSQVGRPGPPFWTYLAGFALLVVVTQWCLSERRWTC